MCRIRALANGTLGDLMGGRDRWDRRVDGRAVAFWGLILSLFWLLSTVSNLFDAAGVLPSLLLGFAEALLLCGISFCIARRRGARR